MLYIHTMKTTQTFSSIQVEEQRLLQRQLEKESGALSYPKKYPIVITKAKGVFVYNLSGDRYYDCLAGAGTLALGHNHPKIKQAIYNCMEQDLPMHTLDILSPIKHKFMEQIFSILPEEMQNRSKIQFCGPTGADAVEAAVKLAKAATGRQHVFTFQGGYHGMTHYTLSLTGNLGAKNQTNAYSFGVHSMPYPYAYRCPFGIGKNGYRYQLNYIENLLNDANSGVPKPACFILEAIQGEGGVIDAPARWLQGIRKITKQHDIPLIIDEVQSGIGRTGKMFAFEYGEIEPDIIVLSKAIGGGLPMSMIVYNESLDSWTAGAHAGTFRGNVLGMATGMEVLKHIEATNLLEKVQILGAYVKGELLQWKNSFDCIGDVRGKGLMLGIEIVDTSKMEDAIGSFPGDAAKAKRIQQKCFDHKLIVELGGRNDNVIRLLPPLNISSDEMNQVLEILYTSIKEVESEDA